MNDELNRFMLAATSFEIAHNRPITIEEAFKAGFNAAVQQQAEEAVQRTADRERMKARIDEFIALVKKLENDWVSASHYWGSPTNYTADRLTKQFVVRFFSITGEQTGQSDPMERMLADATAESWGVHNSGFATVHPADDIA